MIVKHFLYTTCKSVRGSYNPVSRVWFWRKPEYLERTTDHEQATGKLYHLRLRVECTFFCNLQNRARTHAVLVIGLLKVALKHQKSKINQSYSIVSRRKTAKTNHRMKPYSKCLQKGNDHDRKTLREAREEKMCVYSISPNLPKYSHMLVSKF
jgi:hypothetical protein